VALRYNLRRLDTGSLYRAVALAVLDANEDPSNAAAAERAARALDLQAIDGHRIRSAAVGQAASLVAAMSGVRRILREMQRAFATAPGGAVLDGRDIGTVICPDADVKLFVTAALEERARRRSQELSSRGEAIDLAEITQQIEDRDARDATRADSPLRQAPDAHLLDTTGLSIDEAAAAACRIIDSVVGGPRP
jgi:cytidylate kinase